MKKSKVDPKMRKSRSARNKDYRFFLLAGVFLAGLGLYIGKKIFKEAK